MSFGEVERGNFTPRHPRQIFFLLLLRPEEQKRLRHADGLMGGNERGHISIPTAQQDRGASVLELRQPETTVLRRDLDSKGADCGQALEIFWRNLAGAIDLVRIDMFPQIRFELLQKGL